MSAPNGFLLNSPQLTTEQVATAQTRLHGKPLEAVITAVLTLPSKGGKTVEQ